jgi:hypothetical protein
MIPAPTPKNKLLACLSGFVHQLKRTRDYIDVVVPALPVAEDDERVQFFRQTIVLMLHTFLEEYFRCIVSLGTFWNADDVRTFMASRYPNEAHTYEEMPAFELARVVARREVSFNNGAAKLKAIIRLLTNASPFANDWAQSKCLDLVAVRNIITHQGGLATDSNLPTVKSPDVIVAGKALGQATFYHLSIGRRFLSEVLEALAASTTAMEVALTEDPRYQI